MDGITAASVLSTLVLNIANITVLFFIVRALAYKPVKKYMAARADSIKQQLDEVENRLAEADAIKAKAEAEISGAAEAANEKRRSIIEDANRQAKEITAAAEADADRIRENASIHAAQTEAQMMENMRDKIADLSIEIAGRVLEREVKKGDNNDLIAKFFDRVG